MKINSISSQFNFGKTAVATCNVTKKEKKETLPATLYKMDPSNWDDQKEVFFSKNTGCIKYAFDREAENQRYGKGREFYLLKADNNQEVIACAQTLHKFRAGDVQHQGLTTMVEEINENPKYKNGALPLFAYIAHRANDRFDKSVISVTGTDELPKLQKKLKLTETKTDGVFALSKRRFENFINRAKKENQLEIIG